MKSKSSRYFYTEIFENFCNVPTTRACLFAYEASAQDKEQERTVERFMRLYDFRQLPRSRMIFIGSIFEAIVMHLSIVSSLSEPIVDAKIVYN